MKNSILTLSLAAFASCSNPIEEMKENAITEIKSSLLDPKSFELISTKVDTLHYSWQILKQVEPLQKVELMWLDEANKLFDGIEFKQAIGQSASLDIKYAGYYIDSSAAYGERSDKLLKQIENLKKTKKDSAIGYIVDVRYYATNRGGDKAMGENRYYVFNNGSTSLEDISPLAKL
jgi:hypothetical protein